MARFGGNEFTGSFSVPLAFHDRYFIMESGDPPLITVVTLHQGKPVPEVLRNEPVSPGATKTTAGFVTVSDHDEFLYKVRPGSDTSVVFGKLGGGEIEVRITDRNIQVGTNTFENNTFNGVMAGVLVEPDGSIGIGAAVPREVRDWLSQDAD
jgi:hypothetical protein